MLESTTTPLIRMALKFVARMEGLSTLSKCHARGLQPKQIADSMGHDLETHMNSYARFMSKDLESAFDAANKPKEKIAA